MLTLERLRSRRIHLLVGHGSLLHHVPDQADPRRLREEGGGVRAQAGLDAGPAELHAEVEGRGGRPEATREAA